MEIHVEEKRRSQLYGIIDLSDPLDRSNADRNCLAHEGLTN